MIDLSKLNAPGWRRIVADLTQAAGDERAFPNHLLAAMGQVAGARQAAIFVQGGAGQSGEPNQPTATLIWPHSPAEGESANDSLGEPGVMRSSAASSFDTANTQVFGLGSDDGLYDDTHANGYALAIPVGNVPASDADPKPAFVIVLLLDQRSKGAMQSTIALCELLAGYAHLASTRSQLSRLRSAGAALELATRLIASINGSTGFKGSAMQLVNDLCRHLKADRVALGWRDGIAGAAQSSDDLIIERDSTPVKVVALSDTEHVDKRMAMVRKLASAMDECLDQDQPVVFPVPEAGEQKDPALSQTITHAHRELASSDANLKVTSLPLRDGDDALGVITIESAQVGQSIDIRTVELLQATMDLVAPVLRLRKSDDRPIPARLKDEVRKAGAWAVGPKHTLWKLAGIAVMIVALVVTFVSVPYRVEATVQLRPVERRVVAVPFEGIVSEVMPVAEAGENVEAGQLLVKLDTSELELSAIEARQQLSQAQAQAADAMRQGKGAEQQQAEAKARQSQARLDLLTQRIASAEIRAPIAGTIIAGDLTERVGARLELGEPLFEIAPLDDMRLIAEVQDSDIGLVLRALEEDGMTGSVATKAYPDRRFPLTVERVVPMAQAQEGKNSFLVYARLDKSAGWMRPGMEGLAKLEVGDRTLLWIGSRRIVDKLRLWLWW
ncbi:MAG: hypothetical protein Phyf2KO_14910 [Phycisphaerales bacterium]